MCRSYCWSIVIIKMVMVIIMPGQYLLEMVIVYIVTRFIPLIKKCFAEDGFGRKSYYDDTGS